MSSPNEYVTVTLSTLASGADGSPITTSESEMLRSPMNVTVKETGIMPSSVSV